MADTSLHNFSAERSTIVSAPTVKRLDTTYGAAWQRSTVWARAGGLATVACLVITASVRRDVALVSVIGVAILIPAGLIDLLDRRLPNRMVAAAAISMVLAVAVSSTGLGSALQSGWFAGLAVGAGFMAGPLLALHLISPASMGFGDVKIGVVLGASVGVVDPQLSLVALLIASAGSAVFGLVARRRHIAFGPGLILGTVIALAAGPLLISPNTTVAMGLAS